MSTQHRSFKETLKKSYKAILFTRTSSRSTMTLSQFFQNKLLPFTKKSWLLGMNLKDKVLIFLVQT